MSLDLYPPILGELAVEIVVDDVDRLAAIDVFALSGRICVLSHLGPLPAHARHRTRTTPSAAPFFRDAADSSPCLSRRRGSRRSLCRRNTRHQPAARPCGTARAGTRAPL